ncbi:hypothetical protein [Acetobacter aceti]|uniref:hypothetical protein n=1 Tax=Acetobacter aceti TaxID=435 RepID=UPI00162A4E31|nr:hypothetical protein [Acetobacter aceti]
MSTTISVAVTLFLRWRKKFDDVQIFHSFSQTQYSRRLSAPDEEFIKEEMPAFIIDPFNCAKGAQRNSQYVESAMPPKRCVLSCRETILRRRAGWFIGVMRW